MPYNAAKHRRSIRLPGHDYTQPGFYFVTIDAFKYELLFGDVVDGVMKLNAWGEIVQECWMDTPGHFANVELDAFVVMPNHMHGIIVIADAVGATHTPVVEATHTPVVGATHASPLQGPRGPQPGSIGAIVGSFKSACTKRINLLRNAPGAPIWQRNYYEHIIRDEPSLEHIRECIADNPARWQVEARYAVPYHRKRRSNTL